MKLRNLFQDLDYTSFSGVAKALDIFNTELKRARNKGDRGYLQLIFKDLQEWHTSINNYYLACMTADVSPIVRLNVGRTRNEVKSLLKAIEQKLV